MLPREVLHIGDGILQTKPEYLKKILVDAEIEQHYVVEEKPFASLFGSLSNVGYHEHGTDNKNKIKIKSIDDSHSSRENGRKKVKQRN
ncbi:CLUMA_CG007193, isoform A [Clunio marinus]|uniref:CLUMA_CG007193, isoform A n=1 Tax=Clunio marinus TaxID=568069 RepID=A0A1J1HZZ3_9DIPT|nr:CLUMA_CG007193, isoform A [Clunio marinus]